MYLTFKMCAVCKIVLIYLYQNYLFLNVLCVFLFSFEIIQIIQKLPENNNQ